MKIIIATVKFTLRDENGLYELSDVELAQELTNLIEDEHRGIGEYESAFIPKFEVINVKETNNEQG